MVLLAKLYNLNGIRIVLSRLGKFKMSVSDAHLKAALHWTITSPNLLSPGTSQFNLAHTPSNEELATITNVDTKRIVQPTSHFLGPLFESLWRSYLELSPHYQIIDQNLQFHHDGKTLGEIDFLVEDRLRGVIKQQEIAVKFYLEAPFRNTNTPKANAQSNSQSPTQSNHQDSDVHSSRLWIGPNAIDRLDLKLSKFKQQLKLPEHPIVSKYLHQQGISELESEVVLKGILFYQGKPSDLEEGLEKQHSQPYPADAWIAPRHLNPKHVRAYWFWHSDFSEHLSQNLTQNKDQTLWRILDKPYWITALNSDCVRQQKFYTAEQLHEQIRANALDQRAILVSSAQHSEDGQLRETQRLMIVPNDWPGQPR